MKSRIRKTRRLFTKHELRLGRILAGLGIPDYTILILFSTIMGITAGFAGVGLHEAIHLLSQFSWQGILQQELFYLIVLIPAAGMLVQYFMTRIAPKQAKQRGVLEIIKAVGLQNGRIPFRTTLFHFFASAICIGTGGTVGPEAPAAQSGAGAVSAVGKLIGLSDARLRVFTAAGAGAAIAAIFNTPLAGVFFSIEVVLLQDFRGTALSAFLLCSVVASTVSRIFLGNDPAFEMGLFNVGAYKFYVFYFLLGIGAGLVSIAFISFNEQIKLWFKKVNKWVPKPLTMTLVGLLMGLAGWWQPGVLGVGYESMNQILQGGFSGQTVFVLLILKFIMVALILGAGGFGGVFAPSLFLGGAFGFLFAQGVTGLFGIPLDSTTYVLVGMGAVLAGINSVPLTAIMILFEMTNDYHFILPLMLGVVGSSLVVQMTLKGSIYARALKKQGYHYSQGKDSRILESISVGKVVRKDIFTIPENTSLSQLVKQCLEHPHDTIYTTKRNGNISGVIVTSNLHQVITEYQNLIGMVVAQDLADSKVPLLKENDNLETAARLFEKFRVEEIPVVSARSKSDVLGTLHYQDILKAYNNAKIKMNLTDDLADDLNKIHLTETEDVLPGFTIANLSVPKAFVNKTLKQLQLRNRFEVDVLMIEHDGGPFAPDEEPVERIFPTTAYKFRANDGIIVMGKKEKVTAFKEYLRE